MNIVRLPLEGAVNVRELGGYVTKDNKVTKHKVFLRSARLTEITENDNELLKNYGVTDIIDLRGKPEIQDTFVSDDNLKEGYFNFHYIPLSTKEVEAYIKENVDNEDFNFGYGYVLVLERKDNIKRIFDTLIDAEGITLFHCTAGKDRTGIVAALILGVCGVDKKDIIANYEVTATYIKDEAFMESYHKNMKVSKAIFMETFIDGLIEKYGSFEKYLNECGITNDRIEILKKKFLKELED